VPFDFRHVGDNYYDIQWEKNILKNRVLEKSLFYIPNNEEQFYSLLYHAYIQKNEIKADYIPKLTIYGKKIGETFKPECMAAIKLLDKHMQANGYEYIKPEDETVIYNSDNLALSEYAKRYGTFIKRSDEEGSNGYVYNTKVYKSNESYIKIGSKWILENEELFLKKLNGEEHFPKVIKYNKEDEVAYLEISAMAGCNFRSYFGDINHQRKSYIKSFLKECIIILNTLNKFNICHRDFLPENIIISANNNRYSKVSLIDFGWAITNEKTSPATPKNLGGYYSSPEGYSDLYTLGKLLMEYWYDLPYIRRIATVLTCKEALNYKNHKELLRKAEEYIKYPFTPYDELRLFLRRHQRPNYIKQDIKRYIKKLSFYIKG
jgi:predicted Ser/Thr protein kinase